MEYLYVQFSDSLETDIVSYFGSEQSSDSYENLGIIDTGDGRWKKFYISLPAMTQINLPSPVPSDK